MGVFVAHVSKVKEPFLTMEKWRFYINPPQKRGCVTPKNEGNVGLYRLFYIMIYTKKLYVHLSESKTHCNKNINHLHEAHVTITFWHIRREYVTMIQPKTPHSVWSMFQALTPTRTDPWNCSLEHNIQPWNLTWNLKITQLKRKIIFPTHFWVPC